ncbi:hypothetical protein SAMN04488030_3130 [Aliiroseovarius halocynthiae]|nr:hypothetical protein SAMN04488030_3130 [Aliiroseovarius halocynthiae]
MISPALDTNWQKTAQRRRTRPAGACVYVGSCQHVGHAEDKSPFSAMVCRNHYPSPSSTRFSAFASEPGLFSRIDRGWRLARHRSPRKNALGRARIQGTMTATTTLLERGSQTCSTESSSQVRSSLPYWRDASGMTFSAPELAQPQVQWLHKQPVATFLPERSSVRALVRCATTLASASATDLNFFASALRGTSSQNRPAATTRSGGLFYVNQHGTGRCRALT